MHAMGTCRSVLDAKNDCHKFKKQRAEIRNLHTIMEKTNMKVGELKAFQDVHKPKKNSKSRLCQRLPLDQLVK